MKYLRKILVLILLFAVIMLCACSKNQERIFLVTSKESADINVFSKYPTAARYGLYTSTLKTEAKDIKRTKEIKFDNRNISIVEYQYTESAYKTEGSNEVGEFYSAYDIYEGEQAKIEYLHNTDLICFYSSYSNNTNSDIEMNEAMAKEISDNFIQDIIGVNDIEKYKREDIIIDPTGRYMVPYVRYIEGYMTDEVLCVWVDEYGKVDGYNGYNINKYDTILDKISLLKLNETKEAIEEEIGKYKLEDLTFQQTQIITNTSGDAYLEYYVSYTDDNGITCVDSILTLIK